MLEKFRSYGSTVFGVAPDCRQSAPIFLEDIAEPKYAEKENIERRHVEKMVETPRIGTAEIEIIPIAEEHVESFHDALDSVARERKYLTMLEAFPLPETRDFVLSMMKQGNPQVVAVSGGRVLGWCDINRHFFPSHSHGGSLGMGIISGYRGQGLGRLLIEDALDKARKGGFVRVELSVHADNFPAIALYQKVGFVSEGVHRRSVLIDGHFIDTISMAVMLDGQ